MSEERAVIDMEDIRTFRTKNRDGDAIELYLRSCSECPLCTVDNGRMSCGAGVELDQNRDLSTAGIPSGCPLPETVIPKLGPCPVCGSEGGTITIGCRPVSIFGKGVITSCDHCSYGNNYAACMTLRQCADDWERDRLKAEELRREVHACQLNGTCRYCEYFREKEGCSLNPNCHLPLLRICGMWLEKGSPTERDNLGRMPCPLCGSRRLAPVYDREGLRAEEREVIGARCMDCGLSICDTVKWNRVAERCWLARLYDKMEE